MSSTAAAFIRAATEAGKAAGPERGTQTTASFDWVLIFLPRQSLEVRL